MKNLSLKINDKSEFFDSAEKLEERIWQIRKISSDMIVEFNIAMDLKVKLLRGTLNPNSIYDVDMVDLEINGKKIIVQRHSASNPMGLISLSTSSGEDNPYIIIDLISGEDKYNHPYLDRGLCWIIPGNPLKAYFRLHNLNHAILHKGEIAEIVLQAEQKVLEKFDNVQNEE